MNKIMKNLLNVLSDELHEKELIKLEQFIDSEMKSSKFKKDLDLVIESIVEEEFYDEKYKLISYLMLLGLGRNRTIKILKDYEVGRKEIDTVRIKSNFSKLETKKKNEKMITGLKWDSKTRTKREKVFEGLNWEEIKSKYIKGESPIKLGDEYNVSPHIITQRLIEENVFDETRSTITKKKMADEKIEDIDDDYIIELMNNNKTESINSIWRKSQDRYPWLLRRQFHEKLKELGLERTKEEINEIRRIKAKTTTNTDYMIKVNSLKAIREIFHSVDNLVYKYMNSELGTYKDIAKYINENNSFGFQITERQVYRVISNSDKFERKKSVGQFQLYNFIKNTFSDNEVLEEHKYDNTNKRIDIFIPDFNLGIEFNGDYWHSEAMIQNNYGISSFTFHKERAESLAKHKIKLLYVWESDWETKREEIEELIIKKKWDSEMLNKYESEKNKKFGKSDIADKLKELIVEFTEDFDLECVIDPDENYMFIEELNMYINTNTLHNGRTSY